MTTQLAALPASPFDRSAPCVQGSRCGMNQNSNISSRGHSFNVCTLQLPLTLGEIVPECLIHNCKISEEKTGESNYR